MRLNLFRKEKPPLPCVMCSEPFVAACCERPFYEMKDGVSYPDYTFDRYRGLYWCVRVGAIELPWGFGDDALGFGANGSLIVRRRNVNAACFDMKGLSQTRCGEISYVFVNHATALGREGFARSLEPRLLPILRELAGRCGAERFVETAEHELPRSEALVRLLGEHHMVPEAAVVRSVVVYRKSET